MRSSPHSRPVTGLRSASGCSPCGAITTACRAERRTQADSGSSSTGWPSRCSTPPSQATPAATVDAEQLDWLDAMAEASTNPVVVMAHHPQRLGPTAEDPSFTLTRRLERGPRRGVRPAPGDRRLHGRAHAIATGCRWRAAACPASRSGASRTFRVPGPSTRSTTAGSCRSPTASRRPKRWRGASSVASSTPTSASTTRLRTRPPRRALPADPLPLTHPRFRARPGRSSRILPDSGSTQAWVRALGQHRRHPRRRDTLLVMLLA